MATNAKKMPSFLMNDVEANAFPTISGFESAHASSGQLPAEIDIFRFYRDQKPKFDEDLDALDLADESLPTAGDGTAKLFIIEGIDPPVVKRFLGKLKGESKTSFLQFLEDFLDNYSSYDFDNLENHFQPRQSTTTRQRHICFQAMCLREFDGTPGIDREGLFGAIKKALTWKDPRLHGLLMPAQRKKGRMLTEFSPCVLSRNHFAAWFDGSGQDWQTGMVPGLVIQIHNLKLIPP
jgi:hypothetical protein